MSALDKSLDDVISTQRKTRKGLKRKSAKPSAKAALTGSAASATKAKAPKVKAAGAPPHLSEKIIVSNLPPDVTEAQIRELFLNTTGPLKEVTLHHDAHGRSKGVAHVAFSRKGDGTKAYQQYNNRLIDGKRPMKIEIVVDPLKAIPGGPLASRVTPAAGVAAAAAAAPKAKNAKKGKKPTKKTQRPKKTAEDLDAEMEDYTGAATASATA